MGNILPKLVIVAVVAVPVAVLFSINSTGQVLTEHFGPQTLKADPSGQLSTSSDLQIQGTNVLLAIGAAAAFAFSPLGGPFVRGVEVLIDVIDTEYESRFEFFEDDEEFDDEPEDIEPIGEEPVKPKPKPRLSLDEQLLIRAMREGDAESETFYRNRIAHRKQVQGVPNPQPFRMEQPNGEA